MKTSQISASNHELVGVLIVLLASTAVLFWKSSKAWKARFSTTGQAVADGVKEKGADDDEFLEMEQGKGVLVVDDDPVTRRQLRRHLEKLHFRVVEVPDGPSAVRMYEDGHRFCLVLMDYEMPEMNGLSATKEIRRYDDDVVIVGSTIHDPATKQVEFMNAGANLVDIKPISAARLQELVAEYGLAS